MLAKLAFANVRKSARDFAVYFFTLVLGIAVFYAFNSIAGSDAVARISQDSRSMVELLSMVISGVSDVYKRQVYDIAHAPGLKERYNVMSVPCVVVDDGKQVLFGRKNIAQLLDALQ